jgi:hypothetical protein
VPKTYNGEKTASSTNVWLVGDIIEEVFIVITLKLLDCDPV